MVRLHPSTCWPCVVFLADAIFIEGHNMQDVVPHALSLSNKLGLHSGIYLLTCTSDSLNITRYFWAHRDYGLWGYHLLCSVWSVAPLSNGNINWAMIFHTYLNVVTMIVVGILFLVRLCDVVALLMSRNQTVFRSLSRVKHVTLGGLVYRSRSRSTMSYTRYTYQYHYFTLFLPHRYFLLVLSQHVPNRRSPIWCLHHRPRPEGTEI